MKEEFQKWKQTGNEGEKHYDRQTKIIKQTLDTPGHNLNTLVESMRAQGEAALYLCGTRLDNDYGFGSNDLGTVISVLPEDSPKATVPGYHPGSTEIYVVFQGGLQMEILEQGSVAIRHCDQYKVVVIEPGVCHRIRYDPDRKAASFIVKTNPHFAPSVVRCRDCTYYNNIEECPIYHSWTQEKVIPNFGTHDNR